MNHFKEIPKIFNNLIGTFINPINEFDYKSKNESVNLCFLIKESMCL